MYICILVYESKPSIENIDDNNNHLNTSIPDLIPSVSTTAYVVSPTADPIYR